MGVRFLYNTTKVYPDMIKVIIYKDPVMYTTGSVKRNKHVVSDSYTPDITSLNRTKTLIRDIVLCNNFEYFCTFTFDPKKVDRFNFGACYHKMSVWIHHQADNSARLGKKFTYLVIPEQHKSGAWHFHALISQYSGTMKRSGHKSSTGRDVYNITSFRSGFTTAVPIDNSDAVSEYVTKYITKDFITMFNQRRFFCSRGLIRPKKISNSNIFRNTLPLFRRQISDTPTTKTYVIDSLSY